MYVHVRLFNHASRNSILYTMYDLIHVHEYKKIFKKLGNSVIVITKGQMESRRRITGLNVLNNLGKLCAPLSWLVIIFLFCLIHLNTFSVATFRKLHYDSVSVFCCNIT